MAFPKLSKKAEGSHFENEAEAYFRSRNARIIARNVNYRFGELDLVIEEQGPRGVVLVFVEVRKRDPRSFVTAEESLKGKKEQRFIQAAQAFLAGYKGQARDVRLDLVAFHDHQMIHRPHFMMI